jgi:hypothetical protein
MTGFLLPSLSGAVLGGHFDLVEDGKTAVSDSAAATITDLPAAAEPSARFAELVKYLLDLLV